MQFKRKIGKEEADGSFIFIMKDKLKNFPPENEEFELEFKGDKIKTMVEGVYCECAGPEKPHYHYHLWVKDVPLKKGMNILINGDPKSGYKLYIRP